MTHADVPGTSSPTRPVGCDAVTAPPPTILSVNARAVGGGAERVCLDLHLEYLTRGLDSWLALGNLNADVPRAFQIPNDAHRSRWARGLLRPASRLPADGANRMGPTWLAARALRVMAEPARYARVLAGHEDFDFPETRRLLQLAPRFPDIAHLHSLHGSYFDIRAIPEIAAQVPVIITMHDAWLLTGHCAQPLGCDRWRTGCGDCPRLDLYVPIPRDASAQNRRVKREALLGRRVGLATPSRWLMRMVEDSGLAEAPIDARVVPNGVDTRVFSLGDKARARAELGLPQDRTIVAFAARSPEDNPFKDFDTLTEALQTVAAAGDAGGILLLAIGGSQEATLMGPAEVRVIPFVDESERMAQFYQAADLYVHASRAESFGLTVLEAMACGTPVVASDVGGIPEIVVDRECGLLARPGDPRELATRIRELLASEQLRAAFSAAGLERVRSRFTLDQQADAYLAWYRELIEERTPR